MNKSETIHTVASVTSGLMTVVKIDGKEHPVLKIAFDVVSKVMPEAEKVALDIAEGKKPIDSSVELGKKVYSLVSSEKGAFKGKNVKQNISKVTELKNNGVPANPQALKAAAVSNPYALLIIIALSIIEKDVKKIIAITKDILSFLQAEKESEIEADVQTLSSIISKYTVNFDNEKFISSNHKMVLDIQRTARKNMLFYEKRIEERANGKSFAISQNEVESFFKKLNKEFKYYRMSLHTFALASFLEILLSGNFEEENVALIKEEIIEVSNNYINFHAMCLEQIKKISHTSIETNVVKGSGFITGSIGKIFAKSKKEENVARGEKLIATSDKLTDKSREIENTYVAALEDIKDPTTNVFIEKMEEMIFIFNRTGQICCDDESLYLVAE